MVKATKTVGLVLGGGGIKGIAYAGMFDVAEREGIRWGNIAGVSAGALVGAYASAGYNSKELEKILDKFDFAKIEIDKIAKKVPVVTKYVEFSARCRRSGINSYSIPQYFLNSSVFKDSVECTDSVLSFSGYRGNFFKNIVTFSNEGCLYDGDFLEEWVYKSLLKKGIKTFGDLRGGETSENNPRGYRMRMTAVDANRAKVVVLPDDILYYGIEPDKLEVCRAVRMSTCVPFAFKPVVVKKCDEKNTKIHYMVDGGVLDAFPSWLMNTNVNNILGFKLVGNNKNKILSFDTPLNILKTLISSVHDIGVDVKAPKLKYLGEIQTGNISFLDFNLSEQDKRYLYNAGKIASDKLINIYKSDLILSNKSIFEKFTSIIHRH